MLPVEDSFRCSLHDQEVPRVAGVLGLVDGKLVLVHGVEGNFHDLGVSLPPRLDVAQRQFHAFQ